MNDEEVKSEYQILAVDSATPGAAAGGARRPGCGIIAAAAGDSASQARLSYDCSKTE